MALTTLFSAASMLAMAGWVVLLLAPWSRELWRVLATLVAVVLSMLYAGLIGAFWTSAEGDFNSLAGVAQLFGHEGLLLAGWVHYLAFDLLVGLWEREESRRIGLSRWILAPCLLLTLWFGPIGWLLFMGVRSFHLRTSSRPQPTTGAATP
jgi:hypothetical protein